MNELSTIELSRMRSAAEEAMFDLCMINKYVPDAVDVLNIPEDNWADLEEIICGFKNVRNREAMDESEVVMIDAELRIPHDVDLDRRDRIRLTFRLGEFILHADQPTFRIIGEPVHGHAAIVMQLVKDTEV